MIRGRQVLAGYLAICLAVVVQALLNPVVIRSVVNLTVGVMAVCCVALGLLMHPQVYRRPWWMIMAGLATLAVGNTMWAIRFANGDYAVRDGKVYISAQPATTIVECCGYLVILIAGSAMVRHHLSKAAGASVLDMTVVGVGIAMPVWEFVLRPQMDRVGAPIPAQLVSMVVTTALFGCLGSLYGALQVSGRSAASLYYLFATLAWALIGTVHSATALDSQGKQVTPLLDICWGLSFASIGAASLHPSVVRISRPLEGNGAVLTPRRLVYLGAPLLLAPAIGCAPLLYHRNPDVIMLSVAPLVMAVLVLAGIGHLVAEHQRGQLRLEYQATHDELTGLTNRRYLFTQCGALVDRLRAGTLASVTAFYFDLNGFKPINDRYGHEAGDEVLRVVGSRLHACMRSGDLLSRIGGDEFLAICPGVTEIETRDMRDRLQRAIVEPIRCGEHQIEITVAIGSAVMVDGATAAIDDLVRAADRDMYVRKRDAKLCRTSASGLESGSGADPGLASGSDADPGMASGSDAASSLASGSDAAPGRAAGAGTVGAASGSGAAAESPTCQSAQAGWSGQTPHVGTMRRSPDARRAQ